VLIIKFDLLHEKEETPTLCADTTDNALQLTFVFPITCGLAEKMAYVTLPQRYMYAGHTCMHVE